MYKLDADAVMAVPAAYLDPASIVVHRADAKTPSMKYPIVFKDLGWALNKGYTLHDCIPSLTDAEKQALIDACPTANWERVIR